METSPIVGGIRSIRGVDTRPKKRVLSFPSRSVISAHMKYDRKFQMSSVKVKDPPFGASSAVAFIGVAVSKSLVSEMNRITALAIVFVFR